MHRVGVSADFREAALYCKRSEDQGNDIGQFVLAIALSAGWGFRLISLKCVSNTGCLQIKIMLVVNFLIAIALSMAHRLILLQNVCRSE
jgi:predicted Abi (CAAX) family protease